MAQATGAEILEELGYQLRLSPAQRAAFFDRARVIPCRMPFITSQFMPRRMGDRAPVAPRGAENFAVIGQFCEIPRDCVFTWSTRFARPGPPFTASRDRYRPHLPLCAATATHAHSCGPRECFSQVR